MGITIVVITVALVSCVLPGARDFDTEPTPSLFGANETIQPASDGPLRRVVPRGHVGVSGQRIRLESHYHRSRV
jgi:hypothetical protein